jgi:hypothetical protein
VLEIKTTFQQQLATISNNHKKQQITTSDISPHNHIKTNQLSSQMTPENLQQNTTKNNKTTTPKYIPVEL